MSNKSYKVIGFIMLVVSIVFLAICGVYAYNNEMWYEMGCCVLAMPVAIYFSMGMYNTTNENIKKLIEEEF